ncbi:MAG: YwbE family protein [Cyclobacteriaceae bacterium]
MNGKERKYIHPGTPVTIVTKQDQPTGKTTQGIVERILTNSGFHPHGIKVKLISGEVGRVKEILTVDEQ